MKLKTLAALAAGLALGAAGSANAHVYLTQLDWNNLSGTSQNSASVGQVTVTENTDSLSVLVELFDGLRFTDTGNAGNHYPFSFNLAPAGADVEVTSDNDPVTHQTTQRVCTGTGRSRVCNDVTITVVDNAPFTYHGPPGPYNQSAYGDFTAAFDCCGNGGNVSRPSPLEFTVAASGITFLGAPNVGDGFHFFSNTGGWWFAADLVDGNGNTFLAAGRDAICQDCENPTGGVPEPDTWALTIIGFGAIGAVLRRRRTIFA